MLGYLKGSTERCASGQQRHILVALQSPMKMMNIITIFFSAVRVSYFLCSVIPDPLGNLDDPCTVR